jgi:hypothetical protein
VLQARVGLARNRIGDAAGAAFVAALALNGTLRVLGLASNDLEAATADAVEQARTRGRPAPLWAADELLE